MNHLVTYSILKTSYTTVESALEKLRGECIACESPSYMQMVRMGDKRARVLLESHIMPGHLFVEKGRFLESQYIIRDAGFRMSPVHQKANITDLDLDLLRVLCEGMTKDVNQRMANKDWRSRRVEPNNPGQVMVTRIEGAPALRGVILRDDGRQATIMFEGGLVPLRIPSCYLSAE